ncbi:MSHA biogenesis protein MshQ, partial [Aeromonas hydrophila]|nr:MSHA biogenesis protein MshQ [Aeromonas hydrophila]
SRPQAVSIRGSGSGTSGYNYLAGTASNLNPPVDSGTNGNRPHRYRITVDSRTAGSSLTKVERDTGSGYSTLVGPINMAGQSGQAAVPANFLLSLTGSTGSVTNFHEIDNVRICALRSNPVGVQIDHFQLDHSGQALTCNPETVTVKACADAACTTLIQDPVTATLSLTPTSVSNGWIGGNTVTFSGGSTTVQLRNNTATAVTIGVSGSVPTTKPFSTTLCKAGAGTPSAAACTLSFADSGFFFDVPDTYSSQPQTVAIKAVKKSDVTKLCVPGFANQSKSVKFWSSYISPTSNTYNSKMSVNSSVIGTDLGSATLVPLAFDAQGQSTITVKYPDAGKVQLDARYDGTGNEAGLVMTGADQFVARPVGLCITPPQGICSAGDISCPVFKKAGETFQVDIKAMAWESANDGDICAGNQTTPNFALPNIALGSTLVAPNPGTNAAVGTATYSHVPASNSLNSVTQTVSEVGVFRMTATPPAATQPEGSTVSTGYFGYTIPPASSVPVGRFIPADFNLASGDIVPACNVFSYMGQPFGVALDVLARNVAGGQTQNYTGSFAKGSAYLSVANNKDGKSLANRLRSLPSLPWLNGRAALAAGSSEFVRLSDTQPDGPYKSLLFGLYMRDNDGDRTLIASPDFNDSVAGNCSGASCNARLIDSVPMQVYFGRLLAGTGAGLASAPLAVPLQLQYYEAGNWQLNKLDQCTQFSLANQGFTFLNPSHVFDAASRDLSLGGNRKIRLGLGSSAPGGASAQATDGEILFQFARPDISVRIPYRVDLSKQPSQPLWLSDPATLQGEAIFGSSRGNDRIIYRREVMH